MSLLRTRAAAPLALLSLIALCSGALVPPEVAAPPPPEACVLAANGTTACAPATLGDSARAAGAPCGRGDIPCWNELVRRYTNAERARHGGMQPLSLGPRRQLQNAARHAERLGRLGRLRHQVLPRATREVRCKRWIGGENLAYNYATGDVARACVDQWIRSKPHMRNLLRHWFKEVVTGFFFAPDGRVYCVQTFGLKYPWGTVGPADGKDCQPVA